MIDILPTIQYVISVPYFWLSMGTVTACSIFVGAIIYDGNLTMAYKGVISIALYGSFIMMTHIFRVHSLLDISSEMSQFASFRVTYAAVITTLFVTLFWIAGIMIGVSVSKRCHRI